MKYKPNMSEEDVFMIKLSSEPIEMVVDSYPEGRQYIQAYCDLVKLGFIECYCITPRFSYIFHYLHPVTEIERYTGQVKHVVGEREDVCAETWAHIVNDELKDFVIFS